MGGLFWSWIFVVFITDGVFAVKDDSNCFLSGECINSVHIDGALVEDQYKCKDLCNTTSGNCAWFTYYPSSNYCQLLEDCVNLDNTQCTDCVSGKPDCIETEPTCSANGQCKGTVIRIQQKVSSRSQCLRECKNTDDCKWFTYLGDSFICILFSDCETISETCPGQCVSGEGRCPDDSIEESHWHMLIGGKSENDYIGTVELYNWVTGKQCYLASLPQVFGKHSGAVLDGVPVVCGGFETDAKIECYKYSKEDSNWLRVPNLLYKTFEGSSVLVPNIGWFIFGGSNQGYAQHLPTIDGVWQQGPQLYQGAAVSGQCAVQISDNETVFFGGSAATSQVLMYDWSTSEYTVRLPNLFKDRQWSTCGIIKGRDGLPRVAIIGGGSKGMEWWNPKDFSVELISEEIGPEEGGTIGLRYGQMLPIKGGTELLVYGGYKGSHHKGIWKYVVADDSWERVGSMLRARAEQVALAVTGLECP